MIELAVAVGTIAGAIFAGLRRLKPCGCRDNLLMRQCRAHHRPVAVEVPVYTLDGTDTGRTTTTVLLDRGHAWTDDERLARYDPEIVA